MTTLNAKANKAYDDMVEACERENPGDVWVGFEHEREAYEQGWEDGYTIGASEKVAEIHTSLLNLLAGAITSERKNALEKAIQAVEELAP